jgi:hypothetical protein
MPPTFTEAPPVASSVASPPARCPGAPFQNAVRTASANCADCGLLGGMAGSPLAVEGSSHCAAKGVATARPELGRENGSLGSAASGR